MWDSQAPWPAREKGQRRVKADSKLLGENRKQGVFEAPTYPIRGISTKSLPFHRPAITNPAPTIPRRQEEGATKTKALFAWMRP